MDFVDSLARSPMFHAGLLVFARVAGLLLIAPFFPRRIIPARVKLGVLGVISLCVLMAAPLRSDLLTATESTLGRLHGPLDTVLVVGSEVLVGGALGWGCLLAAAAFAAAFRIIAQQVGIAWDDVVDPLEGGSGNVLGELGPLLVVLVFLALDLHHPLIRAVCQSFVWVPPGHVGLESVPVLVSHLVLAVGPDLIVASVMIALHVTVAMLVVSLVQGLAGRLVPSGDPVLMGLPVRLLIGLAVLAVSLDAMTGLCESFLHRSASTAVEELRSVSAR